MAEQFAEHVIASWPDDARDLVTCIETLYRDRLTFPPAWPDHRREAFIASHADLAACELSTLFDDLIDTVTNEYGLQYGVMPHPEEHSQLLHAARRHALDDFRMDTVYMDQVIAGAAAEDPGRGNGSMTACGPRQRLATITIRYSYRRRRHRTRP